MKIGILNSGGGCPGINAALYDTVRAVRFIMPACDIAGVSGGFCGLADNNIMPIEGDDCSFLNTSRISCADISDNDIEKMKKNYDDARLSCVIVFGGDDSAKTSCRLIKSGMNVIFIPKTIENNVFGTDTSLGFYSAVQNAAAAIASVRETAKSHLKVMIAEIEGESGWLALYSGVAAGADIILLPEIPYSYKNIFMAVEERMKKGPGYAVIAISSGAMTQDEYRMTSGERKEKRRRDGVPYISLHLAQIINDMTGIDAKAVIPSYILRGGEPCSYDMLLSKRFAARAANMVRSGESGLAVCVKGTEIDTVSIEDAAKKTRGVPFDDSMISTAINLGINLGV